MPSVLLLLGIWSNYDIFVYLFTYFKYVPCSILPRKCEYIAKAYASWLYWCMAVLGSVSVEGLNLDDSEMTGAAT